MENEFPPNSHSKKEERPARREGKAPSEKKEVQRVTKGKATLRKKPLHKKIADAFRPEDNVGFLEHIILEVFVPGIKDAIAYASTEAIENALGTNTHRGSRRRGGGRGGYTEYNRMGSARPRSRRDRDDDDRGGRKRESRGPSDHQEIIVDSRVEADEVIDNMIELISKYEVATMRDLLSLVGENHNYTDEDWGWTDLRGARIHRIGQQGYLLDLPRPEPLD